MIITLSNLWLLLNITTLLMGTILVLLLLEQFLAKRDFTFFQEQDVSTQVKARLQQLILSEGSLSISTLEAKTGMEEFEITNHIQKIDDIQISSTQHVFSNDYLKRWLSQEVSTELIVDLKTKAEEQKLNFRDFLQVYRSDPQFVLKGNQYLVSRDWVFEQLLMIAKQEGKVVFNAFIEQLQITNVDTFTFGNLIANISLQGIHTSNKEVFITQDFLCTQLREATNVYTVLSFDSISKLLDIPLSYIEEILAIAIKANLIVGKIDQVEKHLSIQEVPVSLAEQLLAGKILTIEEIQQSYNKPLDICLLQLQEELPSSQYVLTRHEDIIRIELIEFNCQICGEITSANFFLKCTECNRDLCWGHFQELRSVGRPVCPYCDNPLLFLPVHCEKCYIDYVLPTKEVCKICGFPIKVRTHLNNYYSKFLEIITKPRDPQKTPPDNNRKSKPK